MLCFGCKRAISVLAQEEQPDFLLEFCDAVPALFHGLRQAAPHASAQFLLHLLQKSAHWQKWQQVDLVLTAPQRRPKGPSGLQILAENLAKSLGAEFSPDFFGKEKNRTQHGRDFRDRVDTSCFVKIAGSPLEMEGRSVLVLDDVLTTGTTLELASYLLRKAGAREVRTFALAYQVMEGLERKREQAHDEGNEVRPLLLHLGV